MDKVIEKGYRAEDIDIDELCNCLKHSVVEREGVYTGEANE
jgi:hypothetical protein